jgi:hypothetical protein
MTAVESVVVFFGVEQLSAGVVDLVRKELLEQSATHPTGVGYLHVQELRSSWRAPDQATRRAYMKLARDVQPILRAGLVVLDVGGFVGAAMRAVVSGLLLPVRGRTPISIVSHFDEGGDWFVHHLRAANPQCPSARDLELVLAQLKQRIMAGVR